MSRGLNCTPEVIVAQCTKNRVAAQPYWKVASHVTTYGMLGSSAYFEGLSTIQRLAARQECRTHQNMYFCKVMTHAGSLSLRWFPCRGSYRARAWRYCNFAARKQGRTGRYRYNFSSLGCMTREGNHLAHWTPVRQPAISCGLLTCSTVIGWD